MNDVRPVTSRTPTALRGAIGAGALLLTSLVVLGVTMPPDQPPTTRETDCTRGGCHAAVTEFKYLHAPAAIGACEICHVYDDPAQHTFKLILKHQDEPVCSFCHIGKSTFGRGGEAGNWAGLHVHDPVRDGDCVACHNPHGSNMRQLINADSISGLCSTCHDGKIGQAHAHPPVADGECLSCHNPHSGQYERLLHQPGRDLCLSCHKEVLPKAAPEQHAAASSHLPAGLSLVGVTMRSVGLTALAAPRAIANREPELKHLIHEPVLGECTQCHDPHGTAYERMLKNDTRTLCSSCHEDVARGIKNSTVHHSPVTDDRACLNCHEPHHSPSVALLRDQPSALCLNCHAGTIAKAGGGQVRGVAELAIAGLHVHGPIAEGRCQDCHDVHGGTRESLLTGHYSRDFYLPFTEHAASSGGAYGLCFSCHDSALVTAQHTTTATKFRDGERNLHYVHVIDQGDSGRSCRMCHTEHASRSPRMVRDSVQYGEWTLPIRFELTDTGGTCAAGCHRERGYARGTAKPAE